MDEIHETITRLVSEERDLRASSEHTEADRGRLARLEEQLDQCWDLLRQRDALRDAGADPEAAKPRSVGQVESYLQ